MAIEPQQYDVPKSRLFFQCNLLPAGLKNHWRGVWGHSLSSEPWGKCGWPPSAGCRSLSKRKGSRWGVKIQVTGMLSGVGQELRTERGSWPAEGFASHAVWLLGGSKPSVQLWHVPVVWFMSVLPQLYIGWYRQFSVRSGGFVLPLCFVGKPVITIIFCSSTVLSFCRSVFCNLVKFDSFFCQISSKEKLK